MANPETAAPGLSASTSIEKDIERYFNLRIGQDNKWRSLLTKILRENAHRPGAQLLLRAIKMYDLDEINHDEFQSQFNAMIHSILGTQNETIMREGEIMLSYNLMHEVVGDHPDEHEISFSPLPLSAPPPMTRRQFGKAVTGTLCAATLLPVASTLLENQQESPASHATALEKKAQDMVNQVAKWMRNPWVSLPMSLSTVIAANTFLSIKPDYEYVAEYREIMDAKPTRYQYESNLFEDRVKLVIRALDQRLQAGVAFFDAVEKDFSASHGALYETRIEEPAFQLTTKDGNPVLLRAVMQSLGELPYKRTVNDKGEIKYTASISDPEKRDICNHGSGTLLHQAAAVAYYLSEGKRWKKDDFEVDFEKKEFHLSPRAYLLLMASELFNVLDSPHKTVSALGKIAPQTRIPHARASTVSGGFLRTGHEDGQQL